MDWTAIGLSRDLLPGMAVPVRLDGTDLALWRGMGGSLRLWGDRCPHRGMRLSHGFVRGETLACIYHGWRYGSDGACAHIPAHPALTPPLTIRATAHAAAEQGGVIWGALAAQDDPPPPLPARFGPLRSLAIDRPEAVVARAFGGAPGGRVLAAEADALLLLLHPVAPDRTIVHALLRAGGDRKAASRRLEAARTAIEGGAHD